MSWIFDGKTFSPENIEKYFGFVYLIENLQTGKKYYGKKQFWFKKTKMSKGKKKRLKVESDWKSYWSSSESLKKDVESLGEQNFKRTILKFCSNKSECSYFEAYYQFVDNVLLKPDQFYNEWISVKISGKHLKKII